MQNETSKIQAKSMSKSIIPKIALQFTAFQKVVVPTSNEWTNISYHLFHTYFFDVMFIPKVAFF